MTAPPDDTTTDTSAIIAALRTERDAALAREAGLAEELAARTAELATRNTEYGERIEQQTATVDILSAMSGSPGDPQPVFVLITRYASERCNSRAVLWEFDGTLMHFRASHGAGYNLEAQRAIIRQFPAPPNRGVISARAVLEQRLIHLADATEDPEIWPLLIANGARSYAAIPLLRDGKPIGAISMNSPIAGGFSDSQIVLLKTFAEQAVIAITSAETYRALQTRTSDLQETLEYQTATSDVLKVISRSAFGLGPVFQVVLETAVRLCRADQATIYRYQDGEYQWAAGYSLYPDYERIEREVRISPGTGTLVGRVALEGCTVQFVDAWSDPLYEVKEDARVGGVHTMLGVPLLRDGVPIGVFGLARRRVEPFTGRQIELVSTFANQAVIAIENTRLLTEQQEALEQQTATAEVLQVINASPGNLTPVFDAILEKAMRLCDAAFGMFNTYDGQSFHTVVTRGVPAAFADFRAKHPPIPGPGSPIGRALETKRPVHVFDWLEDPAYKQGDPGGRAIADLGGARTVLNVPLVKDAAVLGMISFYRQQVRPFSDKQIALLENFAAQAVIAIENARLLDEIRQRTIDLQQSLEYQTATSDVLKVISRSTFDLKPVLEALLSIAKHLCDADYAMVSQREANGFRALATQSASGEWAATLEGRLLLEDRSSVTGRAALAKRPVQIADAASDPDYALSGAVAVGQTRTCLGVPLLRDGVVVGVIILTRTRVEPFSDRQIELVSTFADQAVIAIENTRLLTEQREALEQQTATAEVLQVINANPGNLAPVFDTILEKAHILCSTTCGSLELIDRDRIYAVAVRGFSETFADALRNGDLAADQPATGPLLRGEQYNHIIDVSQIDHPTFRVAAKEGLGTVLFTPLCKDGVLLGMIASARREVRPFSEKEIAVLESFAAQAVIAMENWKTHDC